MSGCDLSLHNALVSGCMLSFIKAVYINDDPRTLEDVTSTLMGP